MCACVRAGVCVGVYVFNKGAVTPTFYKCPFTICHIYFYSSLYTCEDANQFEVCEPGDAAKEKHTGDYWRDGYIYHVVI